VIRNLLSNALKYTRTGKVLVGCRRRGSRLDIEVWDSGIGVPDTEMDAIFEEYHQVNNDARERSRGLGLGLFIVRRLCRLLGHEIRARSRFGKGSVFSVTVDRAPKGLTRSTESQRSNLASGTPSLRRRKGTILIVEDDSDVRATIELMLRDEGHRTITAADGPTALDVVAGLTPPDLVIADYNLPNGMNGFEVAATLGKRLGHRVPLVILSGDVALATTRTAGKPDEEHLQKPVTPAALIAAIQRLLPSPGGPDLHPQPFAADVAGAPVVYVVDDDPDVREAMISVLETDGLEVETYASCEAFLDAYRPGRNACVLIDAYLPGKGGLELLEELRDRHDIMPAIMITGRSDVRMAVQAMKAGASDFIDKPVGRGELLPAITRALEQAKDIGKLRAWRRSAAERLFTLTQRQQEILTLVLTGQPSKIIASDLGISQRTVEGHRALIMKKTGVASLPELARLAIAATQDDFSRSHA
jgi:two-component system, chemotaxis family, CheB/CheR fusion protein